MTTNQDEKIAEGGITDAGFTLLEIMVVLAIIALIAGGVGAAVFKQYKKAQIQTAKMRVKAARDATAQFMMDNSNNCPKGIDRLVAEVPRQEQRQGSLGQGPALPLPRPQDTDSADITSAGPDRQEGSGDDIKSWDRDGGGSISARVGSRGGARALLVQPIAGGADPFGSRSGNGFTLLEILIVMAICAGDGLGARGFPRSPRATCGPRRPSCRARFASCSIGPRRPGRSTAWS